MSMIFFLFNTVLAFGLGFYIGKDWHAHKKIKLPQFKKKPQLKVLKQQEPKSFKERREEALKEDKSMMKIMYK